MQIKYNDSDTRYELNSYHFKGNTVTLKGPFIPENTSGFVILQNGEVLADCSEYKVKYNIMTNIPNGIIYSNTEYFETEDNRVRLPAEVPIETILSEAKVDKIAESKNLLEEFLANHPLQSSCHGGKTGAYSVTSEKQSLMMSQYMTHQIEKTVNPDAVLTWNESGKECEVWTEEEFLQLILEIKAYVYPLVSYQQNLEEQINACASMEELEAITINYGVV